ncbi:MAG: T9SS type A sorting domain-containing protein [Bacteroidota bacterium]
MLLRALLSIGLYYVGSCLLAQCTLGININAATLDCVEETSGNDEIVLRIPFTGRDPNFVVSIVPQTMGLPNPIVAGDDPATDPGGFISISMLFEGATYSISLMGDNCNFGTLTYSVPAGICGVLPVNLRWFSGSELSQGQLLLEWQTEGEWEASYFQLERSTDGGRSFHPLARIAAVGSTEVPQTYRHIDRQAVTGDNYYRLQQVDLDGSRRYYGPLRLFVAESVENLLVYPNPAVGVAQLEWPAEVDGKLQLRDVNGRLLREYVLRGQSRVSLQMVDYPPGLYQIVMRLDNGQLQHKRLLYQP